MQIRCFFLKKLIDFFYPEASPFSTERTARDTFINLLPVHKMEIMLAGGPDNMRQLANWMKTHADWDTYEQYPLYTLFLENGRVDDYWNSSEAVSLRNDLRDLFAYQHTENKMFTRYLKWLHLYHVRTLLQL